MRLRPLFTNILGKMTVTADHNIMRPTSPPLPPAFLSNPDLTKLYSYSHKSCPELKAESVVSSDDSSVGSGFMGSELNNSNAEPRLSMFEPLETHDEERKKDRVVSMDCEEDYDSEVEEEDSEFLPLTRGGPVMTLGDLGENMGEASKPVSSSAPSRIPSIIIPRSPPRSLSSLSDPSSSQVITPNNINDRRKLQWKFKGLTLWLELEEFDNDLTQAVEDFSSKHYSPWIPKPHTTAIYGIEHLSHEEASKRLQRVREVMPNGKWPSFAKPTGVTSDIAVCGRPGQVCSIAWSELTYASNDEHEQALDALYSLFYSEEDGEDVEARHRPWKPHNSIAYDNPETNALSLLDTITYMSVHPTLLGCERRVEAISLWSTVGKMDEWTCIDRVKFF